MVRRPALAALVAPILTACAGGYVPAGPAGAPDPSTSAVALGAGSAPAAWAAADARALSAPRGMARDAPALAAWLTSGARGDAEKARAIFRWLAENVAYDVEGMADPVAVHPEDVLARGRSICDGYAGAFELLGRLAGLEVATIHGYAKGYDYMAGGSFARPNHAWTAVRIDGLWRLVDATWGAGYVAGGRFVKQLDDFFFLPDPAALAYTHLPEDAHWALMPRPLSLRAFESQAVVRAPFFRAGFTAVAAAEALRRGGSGGLVQVSLAPDQPIRFRSAPAQRVLAAGENYRFEAEAPPGASLVLVNEGAWQSLAGSGRVYAGSIRPRRGEVMVAARLPGQQRYQIVLRYQAS